MTPLTSQSQWQLTERCKLVPPVSCEAAEACRAGRHCVPRWQINSQTLGVVDEIIARATFSLHPTLPTHWPYHPCLSTLSIPPQASNVCGQVSNCVGDAA